MARRTTTRNEREQKRSKAWSKREDDEIFERTRPAKKNDQRRLSAAEAHTLGAHRKGWSARRETRDVAQKDLAPRVFEASCRVDTKA
jgi:hypothetical protein